MTKIIIDMETYSDVSINAGSYAYSHGREVDIICMAYQIDNNPIEMWLPGNLLPKEFQTAAIYAHNALFEYNMWQIGVRKYAFPVVPLTRFVDTAALASRFTFPRKLDIVAKTLELTQQKSSAGLSLIKKICAPHNNRRPIMNMDYSAADFEALLEYCKQDVATTYDLVNTLPADKLSEYEDWVWRFTCFINQRGLPVDTEVCEKIYDYILSYVDEMQGQLAELTDGRVTKATQTKRIRDWIESKGIELPNLQAGTVEKVLKDSTLPENVRLVLKLRQTLARSSTAKFKKLLSMAYNDRIYDNLIYHGTGTGRWSGSGFQLQNLPRASVDNPDDMLERFRTFRPVEDPVNIAKALIRSVICAPEGKMLLVSDYHSIENILTMWVADEQEVLQDIRNGIDLYKKMACRLFGCEYANVSKYQRTVGKIIVLGCGYQMGWLRLQETAESWGVTMFDEEAQYAVNTYRGAHPKLKKTWKHLQICAIAAIQNPGVPYETNKCVFKTTIDRAGRNWLLLTLPSKRKLYYCQPFIEQGKYGPEVRHYGINPYSKKWGPKTLTPGRLIENIIQGIARDVLVDGCMAIEAFMPEALLIGLVHDEAIAEVAEIDITDDTINRFNNLLCTSSDWCDAPITAEGWIGKRYKK